MKTIWTVLSMLIGTIIGFAVGGLGTAYVLSSRFGSRDGGPGMTGFFYFGPVGALAGALVALGLVNRLLQGSPKWRLGFFVAGGIVAASGSILLGVVLASDRELSYSEVVEFELEYPRTTLANIAIPSSSAMWGAAGDDMDDKPISQFFEKKCSGDLCILQGAVAAIAPTNNFRINTSIGIKKQRYRIRLPPVISGPVDWSAWEEGDGTRIRWRIVKR